MSGFVRGWQRLPEWAAASETAVIVPPETWGTSRVIVVGMVAGTWLVVALMRELFWLRALDRPMALLRMVRYMRRSPEETERLLRLLLDAQGQVADARRHSDGGRRKVQQPREPREADLDE
jgi:hypothetical protein